MRPEEYDKLANKLLPFILAKVRQAARVTPAAITGDMSAYAIMAAVQSLDGAGSGLDADTVDGMHESAFLLAAGSRAGAISQAQTFTGGVVAPFMRPAADSTTALQLQNAAGTAVVTIDTTNSRVGIGATPITGVKFSSYYSESNTTAEMYAGKFDVVRTTIGSTVNTYGLRGETDIRGSGTVGGEHYGLRFVASGSLTSGSISTMIGLGVLAETIGAGTFADARCLLVLGVGSANGTTLRGALISLAQSGTWTTVYGLQIANIPTATNRYAIHTGTGGIHFGGLIDYANNAAAVSAGLTAGDLYTETGTNPKRVCMVY